MSLENLKLGMGLGKSLYQKVPTKYVPLDGIDVRLPKDSASSFLFRRLPLILVMVGIFLIWREGV